MVEGEGTAVFPPEPAITGIEEGDSREIVIRITCAILKTPGRLCPWVLLSRCGCCPSKWTSKTRRSASAWRSRLRKAADVELGGSVSSFQCFAAKDRSSYEREAARATLAAAAHLRQPMLRCPFEVPGTPALAKCAAMRAPIVPAPRIATL